MYFNQVAYGGTTWGVEAAAETYFGKHSKDLDLAQSSFLAGIPRAPSIYSPYSSTPTLWKKRQHEVLGKMVELGYITKEQSQEAQNEDLVFRAQQSPLHAPHFVMYVRDLLVKKYGSPFVERGGLSVTTSIDLPLQAKVQKIVSDEVVSDSYLNLTNGASVVTNPKNGDVLAMVGSRDFDDPKSGNVNVTTSLRQPGSSIKSVTYAAALSKGFTAASILDDSPVSFKTPNGQAYSPVNYDGKFHGRPSLRIAFANSFNIPAVRTLNQIGIENFVDLGKRMGITTWGDPGNYGLSITLGAAEVKMVDMATLYGVFANSGVRVDVNPILKITDGKGNVLEEKKDEQGIRVLDQGVSFIVSSILSDNQARSLEFGINSPLNIPNHTVSVKTGTSDSKRDNWTIGYTKDRLVAVWVGNNDNSPMSQQLASGITGAAPIWNKIMSTLLQGKPDEKLQQPDDITTKPCLGRIEYFIKGTENSVNCAFVPTPSAIPTP
jgi:membrane peptidoglycan carboxypeptidase